MQYLSGYFWRQEETVSLVLKHLVYPGKEPVFFGCLGQGERASYFCKWFTEWFYREGLCFCKKGNITSEMLKAQLEEQMKSGWVKGHDSDRADKDLAQDSAMLTGAVLLCVGEIFALWSSPGQQIYILNIRFERSQIRLLADGKKENILCGKIQKGVGIFIPTSGMSLQMKAEELKECLAVKILTDEERIEKRLREIGAEAVKRGAEYASSMLVVTC